MEKLRAAAPGDAAMTSAVLLDIDGTLIDSTYHHAVAWHRAFSRIAEVPPLWRLHRAIGMGGDRLVAAVAGDTVEEEHGDDLRDSLAEGVRSSCVRRCVRYPAQPTLVHKLVRDGFVVALASSGDPQFSREAVELLGIESGIAALLTSEDVDSSKPDPELIQETLSRLDGVEAAVFVGDTVYDVEAAARAGIGCIALRSGGFGRAELEDAGALASRSSLRPDRSRLGQGDQPLTAIGDERSGGRLQPAVGVTDDQPVGDRERERPVEPAGLPVAAHRPTWRGRRDRSGRSPRGRARSGPSRERPGGRGGLRWMPSVAASA